MKWNVQLEVSIPHSAPAGQVRVFAVESKSVAMALEKAVQQARHAGWEPISVRSCNPLVALPRISYGWAGSQIA